MQKKPNIIWIVLDHVTFRHYKMTKGARPVLNTYERLAAKGMEFTNCHSVHPLCLPARASMMTGMYSHHHGKINNGLHKDKEYPFVSEYLKALNYKVGYFGKNHSGCANLETKGFEGYFPRGYGNPYMSNEYKEYIKDNGFQSPIYHQEWGIETDKCNWENGDYDLTSIGNFNTYTSGYIKTPGPVHEVDFILSLAMDWMDKRIDNDEAFMVRLDTWGPHHAFQVPLEFKDLINPDDIEEYPSFGSDNELRPEFSKNFIKHIKNINPNNSWKEWQPVMKRAYENFSYIDAALGRLLDKLEMRGISDNTIIIYTADHGDALGSHGGMVDKAGDMMEEVMHIPMVMSWPGITCGTKSDALVSNLDIVPTVLEMVGLRPPEFMDGQSVVSLLEGSGTHVRDDFMAEHYGHFKIDKLQRVLYYKNYKYIAATGDIHEVYDLAKDPFEMNNLINCKTEKDVICELRRRLLDNMARYNDFAEDAQALINEIKEKGTS